MPDVVGRILLSDAFEFDFAVAVPVVALLLDASPGH
jgi:hypothetical protein